MATKKTKAKSDTIPKWGKELSPSELSRLLKRIDKKLEEKEMSKLSDTLKQALAKKKGVQHIENADAPATEKKARVKTTPPAGKKPPTRSAGRGR